MSANKAFKQWMKKRCNIGEFDEFSHQDECPNDRYFPNVPLNESPCNCYELAIFRAGYNAAKGIANNE